MKGQMARLSRPGMVGLVDAPKELVSAEMYIGEEWR